jgi:hypothetical protein
LIHTIQRENKGSCSLPVLYESKTTFVLSLHCMNQRLPLLSPCIVWIKDYLCSLFVLYESKTTFVLSYTIQGENKGSLWFIQYKERTKVVFDSYNTKREQRYSLIHKIQRENKGSLSTFVLSLYCMNQRLPLFSLCILWIKDYLCSLFVLYESKTTNKCSLWFIQYKERTKVVFDSYNTKREQR